MLVQIQEMLLIEKGGEAQLADELAAYNPLVPKGRALVATVMFEVDDPVRRARLLGNLGSVERHFYLQVDDERIDGIPEEEDECTRDDGKTSAVGSLKNLSRYDSLGQRGLGGIHAGAKGTGSTGAVHFRIVAPAHP